MNKFLVRHDSVYLEEIEIIPNEELGERTLFISEEKNESELKEFLDNIFDTYNEACQFIVDRERKSLKSLEKRLEKYLTHKEDGFIETKTNWRGMECIFSELPKMLINRVDLRIKNGDEGNRVKHTSDKIDQDGSWNSLMLDEMARVYAMLGMKYEAIEKKDLTREQFISIYCKDEK